MKYPFAPLAAAMGLNENRALRVLGLTGSTGQDYRRNGITERVADRLAVKAGLHPFVVWPELAQDLIDLASVPCPECKAPFIPLRRSHRYCTRACYQRRYKREKARQRYAADGEFRRTQRAKSKAYRQENRRAVLVKKRVYYQRNAEVLREKERARKAAKRDQIHNEQAALSPTFGAEVAA